MFHRKIDDLMLSTYFWLTPNDMNEIALFQKFVRLVGEAERAGCTKNEAIHAILPDVYGPEKSVPDNKK